MALTVFVDRHLLPHLLSYPHGKGLEGDIEAIQQQLATKLRSQSGNARTPAEQINAEIQDKEAVLRALCRQTTQEVDHPPTLSSQAMPAAVQFSVASPSTTPIASPTLTPRRRIDVVASTTEASLSAQKLQQMAESTDSDETLSESSSTASVQSVLAASTDTNASPHQGLLEGQISELRQEITLLKAKLQETKALSTASEQSDTPIEHEAAQRKLRNGKTLREVLNEPDRTFHATLKDLGDSSPSTVGILKSLVAVRLYLKFLACTQKAKAKLAKHEFGAEMVFFEELKHLLSAAEEQAHTVRMQTVPGTNYAPASFEAMLTAIKTALISYHQFALGQDTESGAKMGEVHAWSAATEAQLNASGAFCVFKKHMQHYVMLNIARDMSPDNPYTSAMMATAKKVMSVCFQLTSMVTKTPYTEPQSDAMTAMRKRDTAARLVRHMYAAVKDEAADQMADVNKVTYVRAVLKVIKTALEEAESLPEPSYDWARKLAAAARVDVTQKLDVALSKAIAEIQQGEYFQDIECQSKTVRHQTQVGFF